MTDIVTIVDRIEKWLEELESGKHKQGKEYLCRGDRYCCLGVAAEFVLGLGVAKTPDWLPQDVKAYNGTDNVDLVAVLKGGSHTDLGLANSDGSGETELAEDSEFASLVNLNDIGKSFSEIAAIIREDLSTNKYGYFIEAVYPEWEKRHAK